MQPRLRFAPSPTGPLHIGGVRTALYNYLLAKNLGGTFIIRIEDTDQSRYVPGAEEYILQSMAWLGIEADEDPNNDGPLGPYRQSQRKEIYHKYALALVDTGWAYYAFDSSEDLTNYREVAEKKGERFLYGPLNRKELNNSLSLNESETLSRIENGEDFVVRFKTPENKEIVFHDEIRGKITVNTNTLDDKVLYKSDGMPTYHLANVVDDHLMQITHVVRGEEWLPSLALHTLLYQAFEWTAPLFAHLPLLLKPTGKGKLSKRDGEAGGFPVFPLSWNESIGYKEAGYEPEALLNFLGLLGWNPGDDTEEMTLAEMVEKFSLGRVQKSGARFDLEKLNWFNAQALQKLDPTEIVARYKKRNNNFDAVPESVLVAGVSLVKERLIKVDDLNDQQYLFQKPHSYDDKAVKKQWKEETPELLQAFLEDLALIPEGSEPVKKAIHNFCQKHEIGMGKIMAPLRIALVGSLQGPSVDELINFLGIDTVKKRINIACEKL
ncbi:MAG: glutamate--tRNA ligase [Flavobacteriaceae bacterium]